MYCSMRTRAVLYAGIHLIFAVICLILGLIISDKDEEIRDTNNEFDGFMYTVTIGLGGLMLLTGVCGFLVMMAPVKCRMTCYLVLCGISMVVNLVLCVPIISGPITHYSFELKVTKEYYRIHGPESIYHKPQSYFNKRNKIGSRGCGMYGAIVTLLLLDTIMSALSCHLWKTILYRLIEVQIERALRRGAPQHPPSANTANNDQSSAQELVILPEIQSGFATDNRPPSYTDLYPEGSDPTLENQSDNLPQETPEQLSGSRDPESDSPPAYNEICNTQNTPAIDNPPDYEQTLQNDTSSFETP